MLEQINLEIAPRAVRGAGRALGLRQDHILDACCSARSGRRAARITVEGEPLKPEPKSDRGVVFQRYSVFPHLTVLGNVMHRPRVREGRGCFGRLFGASAAPRAIEEARELLAAVGLAGAREANIRRRFRAACSSGWLWRRRSCAGRRCLLLDEPFGALDPGIRADIHVLMRRIWNETELTVVMVTHDLSEAFELGTRVIAFERPRNRPEERERYGAQLSADITPPINGAVLPTGATVTKDIEIWPKKVAGSPGVLTRHGHSAPSLIGLHASARDDLRRLLSNPGRPGLARQLRL